MSIYNYMRTIFVILVLFPSLAYSCAENIEIENLFKNSQTKGTIVIYNVDSDNTICYNYSRAKTRYIPASTFKITNSLIGLETNTVKNVDDILPYKGIQKPLVQAWAHDMGLKKAIAISNVPIYQELARRIGLKQMNDMLVKLNYGNHKVGNAIDRFWLDGPLQISAFEQTEFITKLIQSKLNLSKETQKSVREILLLEEGADWKLYGKTGWQNFPKNGIGWFVGWLNKKGKVYVFALNLDIKQASDAKKRTSLVKDSFKLLGLI